MPLSDGFYENAKEIVARYPSPRSALLMLVHEAQDEVGHVSGDVIREVAKVLGLSAADVAGVVTFYTMFKMRPPGRYLISLCTNLSCAINGADETADALARVVGPANETTADGLCSWESVECLATCHWAPAAQVNYRDVGHLDPERAQSLVEALRAGRELDDVLDELGRALPVGEASNG